VHVRHARRLADGRLDDQQRPRLGVGAVDRVDDDQPVAALQQLLQQRDAADPGLQQLDAGGRSVSRSATAKPKPSSRRRTLPTQATRILRTSSTRRGKVAA
jgi:hypothetical protein